jgi:hypothetical protein
MAKKVRRAKKRGQQKRKPVPSAQETVSKAETTEALHEPQSTTTDQFRQEYAYVVKDLRRVLILAAIMFALLIALNLLLQ